MTGDWIQSRWKWAAYFGFWTLVGLAFAGQLYLSRANIGSPVTWGFAIQRALSDWYVFAVLSIPAMALARAFRLEQRAWRGPLAVHVLASGGYSLAWMTLRAFLEQWQSRGGSAPITFQAAFTHALVATFFFNLLVYWVIVAVVHAVGYYLKYQERELHAVELQNHLAQARLQALQMQLNPHFLFNTLHSISALMHRDVDAADRMLTRLGDLLRATLEGSQTQEVPLQQELEFLDRYLEIERTRFGPRLQVEMDTPPETLRGLVPNLLLQPLVENAIQHGVEPVARPGKVRIQAARQQDRLLLLVEDNGAGLAQDMTEGVGLSNTRNRLHQLYGAGHELALEPSATGGVRVRIVIPWRESDGAARAGRMLPPERTRWQGLH